MALATVPEHQLGSRLHGECQPQLGSDTTLNAKMIAEHASLVQVIQHLDAHRELAGPVWSQLAASLITADTAAHIKQSKKKASLWNESYRTIGKLLDYYVVQLFNDP